MELILGAKMRFADLFEKNKSNMAIFFAYVMLSLAFTFPLPLEISTHIPGPGVDSWASIWNLWWGKEAVLNLKNPLYSDLGYYPVGALQMPFVLVLVEDVISIPFQMMFGLIAAYNMMLLLSMILSAFFTYLLAEYLTKNKRGAFVAGIIFSFAPVHAVRAFGHVNVMFIEWIPLFALLFIKSFREKGYANPLAAGLVFSAASIGKWQFSIYMIILAAMFLLYECATKGLKPDKELFIKLGAMTTVAFAILLPFAVPMLQHAEKTQMVINANEVAVFSADLVAFIFPFHCALFDQCPFENTILTPIGHALGSTERIYLSRNIIENSIFVGYTVIFLGIYAITRLKNKEMLFWAAAGAVFFLLSLGPSLRIGGIDTGVALPYGILYNLFPFLDFIRVPSRFSIMLMLSLSILSAHSISAMIKHKKNTIYSRYGIVALFSLLILFEFAQLPFPTVKADAPEIYYKIGAETGDFAVLEIPISGPEYPYYQTISKKKVMGGVVEYYLPQFGEFISRTPLLNQFSAAPTPDDIVVQNLSLIGKNILNFYGVKYAIVHNNSYPETIGKVFTKYDVIFDDGETVAYNVLPTARRPFMEISKGWYPLETDGAGMFRWTNGSASVKIFSSGADMAKIYLMSREPWVNGSIKIYLNDELVDAKNISTTFNHFSTRLIKLKNGENILSFVSEDGCEIRNEYWDTRCLGTAFKNISISAIGDIVAAGEDMILEKGWYSPESDDTDTYRWSSNGTLSVLSDREHDSKLKMTLRSFDRNRTLYVYANGNLLSAYNITNIRATVETPRFKIVRGDNRLQFLADGCDAPRDLYATSNDARCLSFAFSNISEIRLEKTYVSLELLNPVNATRYNEAMVIKISDILDAEFGVPQKMIDDSGSVVKFKIDDWDSSGNATRNDSLVFTASFEPNGHRRYYFSDAPSQETLAQSEGRNISVNDDDERCSYYSLCSPHKTYKPHELNSSGFSQPEQLGDDEWMWSNASRSSIALPLLRDQHVSINGAAASCSDSAPRIYFVNDSETAEVHDFPFDAFAINGTLEFEYENPVIPALCEGNNDNRTIALKITSIEVEKLYKYPPLLGKAYKMEKWTEKRIM